MGIIFRTLFDLFAAELELIYLVMALSMYS